MMSRIARAALLTATLALAACSGQSLEDIAPKAERELPARLVQTIKAKGMRKDAPIMMRIFKEEGVLEVWKQKQNGRYDLVTSYDICKWSGELGPKYTEGDRQAPEGFYSVRPAQMNPRSSYHLSFNIGFPNAYDSVNGRTGKHLMVHGACSSAGCYSMTDEQVEEIYAFARDAFRGGQQAFQVQAFPFRMTPQNMARYRNDPNYPFWTMLKEGYDHFEITKQPPRVDVCERRYVFNRAPAEGHSFEANEVCPPSTQPETLVRAYQKYKAQQDIAFAKAVKTEKHPEPLPSILGREEALLVADWSQRRARGEKVSQQPPSLPSVAVAAREEPAAEQTPVSAYASAFGASSAQSQMGAPPLTTGSLPVPAPNPNRTQNQEEPEASSRPKVVDRFMNLFDR
ncbi:murein L,D-transpeptidase family protein [Chelativorans sp. M5D2P16]|uniref:murein L,D-transpeptidase family protein n=1 Tax=Chelativorans sp. M5D2P16 TaxID=3095678 RepID=UPI002ACA2C87|nr:murein L,D-transpeptidase family protein [Chelativorans sp. M5D2P16]MDZ5699091.1 murein L,D-transpeptidase family protein [Chelativorans sp. M5D2P16]